MCIFDGIDKIKSCSVPTIIFYYNSDVGILFDHGGVLRRGNIVSVFDYSVV